MGDVSAVESDQPYIESSDETSGFESDGGMEVEQEKSAIPNAEVCVPYSSHENP